MIIKNKKLVDAWKLYMTIKELTALLKKVESMSYLFDDAEYITYVRNTAPDLRQEAANKLDMLMFRICCEVCDELPEKYSLSRVECHFRGVFKFLYDHKYFNPTVDDFTIYYHRIYDAFVYLGTNSKDYISTGIVWDKKNNIPKPVDFFGLNTTAISQDWEWWD